MYPKLTTHNQEGFTVIEMMVAVTIMIIVSAGVFSLMKSSMTIATASYEMTDAQENLRIAQEYINRDLMNAGDGLKSISSIRVPSGFTTSYLTLNPIVDPLDNMPVGIINLGILTTDNNLPAGTTVTGASPAATIRTGTDRQTILEIDPQFIPITPSAISSSGKVVTLPVGTNMGPFTVGEIYYFSSSLGATFATLTSKDATARTLTFNNGDAYGLNLDSTSNNIKIISTNGTLATSLQRMMIIHYYVNSSAFLMRRVFGVSGAAFRDSIIAEHVLNVQLNYSLETTDSNGNVVQPTGMLTTKAQRIGVRSVEVTVTVETPHVLQNNSRSTLSMTTSTSVRNMQFRQAAQPGS
jgi:Tfp pilus assembly protein PilW